MGTENSSAETRQRAKDLAEDIGRYVITSAFGWLYSQYHSYHVDINIDTIIAAITDLFGVATGLKPKFKVHGGSYAENIALQNIQVGKNLAFEQANTSPRRACVCCFHIFSLNCFHGCVVEWVVY